MKIGLYFGSFNPIHNGHLIIASHLADNTELQQIWFVVSPQNPFKKAESLLNENHRLHLVRTAIEGDVRFSASNIEFGLPKPSYTVDTLTYLREKYPQHQFAVIMGSDSLQNLAKWKNAEVILAEYPIYVYRRPGFEILDFAGARIVVADAPLLEISSTRIRDILKSGKSVRYWVPDNVRLEIERNHYYQ